jgi:hypothetical protein
MRHRGSRRWISLLPFVAAALLAMPLLAQTNVGNIYGRVTDTAGDVLPGVTVTVNSGGAQQTTVSDSDGSFRFLRLPPGRYRLTAELAGFGTLTRNVEVNLGRNSEITVALTQEMREAITVTAATPLIDTRQTGTEGVVTQVELENLPTARDPWVMLQQMPGVLVDRVNVGGNKSGQQSYFVSKGAERNQTSWNIDGVNVTEMDETGTTTFYYDFGSLQEFQVVTSSADPAVRTPGVQVNMVTKRGSNDITGTGRIFWADEELQATATVPNSIREGNRVDNVTEWGVDVGGPIIRDRMWFYGAFGENEISNITFAWSFPQVTKLTNWTAKLNAQPSNNNNASLYYMFSDKTVNARDLSSTRPPETARRQSGPGWVLKLEDTHLFSSNFVLTGLLAKVDSGYKQEPRGGMDVEPYWINTAGLLGEARGWHGSYRLSEQMVEQNNYRLDGSNFLRTGSLNHELKFGAGYRDSPTEWWVTWPGNMSWAEYYSSFTLAALSRPAHPIYVGEYTDFYIGDTLTFGNFTIQGGLRYDLQRSFNKASEVPANPVIPDILIATSYPGDSRKLEWETITPKIGATWALGRNNRTVLRGSYSQYADQLGASDAGSNNPFYDFQVLYYDWTDLNGDRRVQRNELGDLDSWSNIDPANLGAGGTSTGRIDYANHEPTMTNEFILGLEHELFTGFAVGVAYTYRLRDNFIWDQYEKTKGGGDFYTADDYVLAANPFTGVMPDGSTYTIPYYQLKPGVPRPTYYATRNRPDYEQIYQGVELSAQRRMANRWMMRAQVTLADWTQNVGPRGVQNPSRLLVGDGCYTCDNSTVASSNGSDGYINSRWAYSLTGIVELPWRVNLGAVVTGREGYIQGYNVRERVDNVFRRYVINDFDDYRLPDLFQVDLRLGKEFAIRNFAFELGIDAFNITNERTILWRDYEIVRRATAPPPTPIQEMQSPRIVRLGGKIRF